MSAATTRSLRAVSEYMSVLREAPDLYTVVSQSGREYTVDLRDDPACTCPDFQYREDVEECKHVLRARLEAGEDVDRVRARLAMEAIDAEEEARRLERESEASRRRARRIRRALEKVDDLAESD